MKRPYIAAYRALKVMGVPVFANEDHDRLGNFGIDGESPASRPWCEYYFPDPEWSFGVSPELDAVLSQYNLRCEWVNPGSLAVYES